MMAATTLYSETNKKYSYTQLLNKEDQIHQLLQDCLNKKDKARRALYDMFASQMYNAIHRITNQRQDSEDVLQLAFVKIFDKIEVYDVARGSVFSWMYRICINEAISHIRKNKIQFVEISDVSIEEKYSDNIIDEMTIDYIHNAIRELPDIYRVIFTLYEIEGYNHVEIGDKLKIGVPTSRSYLSRAKVQLRKILNEKMLQINSL